MSDLLTYFQGQRQAMVDLLTTLVHYETPTRGKAEVDLLGAFMEQQFHALGASSVQRIPVAEVGDMRLAKWNETAPGLPILFLMHIDTVWPVGTLANRPVTIDAEGKLFGPGAVDMKGGITIVLTALRGLIERGEMPHRPIWVLMTTDEEVGSIHSKQTIIDIAKQCGLVLVMEPATKEEALKTQRKGIATYDVRVEGRASHAGNAPEQGINAIVDLAQQIMALNAMNDLKNGTSVSVTMVSGGITMNVIPPLAEATVDVRTLTARAYQEINEKILARTPFVPGARVTVQQHHARGPMERNAQMIAAFNQTKAIGAKYGVTVREDSSGGASDGNFTAYEGIVTLDGLGPQGDGLHAEHEHVVVNSLPRRATLIAGMLRDWHFD
ncbi:MAG: M20 family metallopeptidase [Anaerolineae bacterium]|nr:M20 family metallopeptidase [Anaerolineae bacterium]